MKIGNNNMTKIETHVETEADVSTIVSVIGDKNLALLSTYNGNQWIYSMGELSFDGKWHSTGGTLQNNVPLWTENTKRDTFIRKLFVDFELCGITDRTDKTLLLNDIKKSVKPDMVVTVEDIAELDGDMPKDFTYVPSVTYKMFIDKMKENYYIDDESIQVITLATMLSNFKKEGNPVWLLIVAPASGGKTELIRLLTLNGKPNKFSHPISTLTPNTFISGMEGNVDLLPRLNGKIFTMKDFTTILSMNADTRNAILGQLREIYDGYFSKETGSGVGTKGYKTHFTLISGVTPTIDKFASIQSTMGERFIRIRQHAEVGNEKAELFRHKVAKMASEVKPENEEENRQKLSDYLLSMLSDFEEKWEEYRPKIDGASLFNIVNCSEITSVLRSGIERDYDGNICMKPEPEFAPRLEMSYIKLSESIAWLLGKDTVDLECISYIYRVALDTVEKNRVTMLKILDDSPQTTAEISIEFGLSNKVTFKILDELYVLGLVNKTKMEEEEKEDEDKKSNKGNPWMWTVNDDSPTIKSIRAVEKIFSKIGTTENHHYNIF